MRVKLTSTQLNKIKSAAKSKTVTILRINKINFEDVELPDEFILETTQTAKIRNVFANNMSTDIKLIRTQISKIIQSGGSFSYCLGNLGKKALANIVISLVRHNLPGLVSNLTSNTIKKFERKINGKGATRAGKGFTSFISNEDMNDIIKTIISIEDSGALID